MLVVVEGVYGGYCDLVFEFDCVCDYDYDWLW